MKTVLMIGIKIDPPDPQNNSWWWGFESEDRSYRAFNVIPHIMQPIEAWEELPRSIEAALA